MTSDAGALGDGPFGLGSNLQYDLVGFCGCKRAQLFTSDEGVELDAGMGFDRLCSKKSDARNRLENSLRLQKATAKALRTEFALCCLECGPGQAAPLLGDVNLLTCMSDDYRRAGVSEAAVREALVNDLRELLRGHGFRGRGALESCLEHAYHFPVA